MKYSYEIKLKAVKALKKGILTKEPYNKISRHWRDIVKHWEKIYDIHGESGFKRRYRKHIYKEKLIAVKDSDSKYTKEEIEYILAENAY